MIDGVASAFMELMTWPVPLYLLAGSLIGLVVGVLPGLGGAATMALLIPFTFGMNTTAALAFLMAVGLGSGIAGQVTSILISVPGDVPNAATVTDGFQMTKNGRATEALSAATFGSLVGTVIGMVLMLALLPFARQIVMAFSYPEFFMVAVLGLFVVSRLAGQSTHKGLISAAFGVMLAFVGLDPVYGAQRFTFGSLYLWDGVDIVAPLIGLFAGAEMLELFSSKPGQSLATQLKDKSTTLDGLKATIRHWRVVIKSSLIGFFVGLVPGIGGTVTAFLAYGSAARSSKNSDRFGKGAVEGVIAPETANDADKGGGLLPTLTFGIPAGVTYAVLLSGLVLHGVPAGPNLLRSHLDVVYVLAVAAFLPRLLVAAIVLLLGSRASILTRIRGDVLAPSIVVIVVLSVYALNGDVLDVFMMLLFCYIGICMKRYGFSRITLMIGLVLGGMVERSFQQTMLAFGPLGFLSRPFSLALLALLLALIVAPFGRRLVKRRRPASPKAQSPSLPTAPESSRTPRS